MNTQQVVGDDLLESLCACAGDVGILGNGPSCVIEKNIDASESPDHLRDHPRQSSFAGDVRFDEDGPPAICADRPGEVGTGIGQIDNGNACAFARKDPA